MGETTICSLGDHVTFRYRPDGQEVLADVVLEIPAGQMVGIVGPSGSGKSTLTKLVQRLYVPERGRVTVDGIDLSLVDPAWLRRQVGVVLQENVLFSGTVRENIACGRPNVPLQQVTEASKAAHAHQFVQRLPQRVNRIMDAVANNELKVTVDAIDEKYLMAGFQKVANRITVGLILAALIVGAALLMRVDTPFRLFGYPGLAIVFFLLAATGGVVLMWHILFHDESARKGS